ncbi:hypothetical protein MYRNA_125 [Mycobacterium phage Myrna]|uniref:Uncharacterized protein n=1 Tax=Mycobacterium phage Myrna TaxID=546805 RepID=B5LJC9_9CAUD|nr:gp125 [Mycobacterium phage Myrna]ACH62126.1 hypothetical protein MYRNA_125 [Mycobacterium phage Myrna]
MSMPIQRHSDSYAPFMKDAAAYNARDRHAAIDDTEVADLLRGPSIMAGLMQRQAVDTRGMDPDSHAYHEHPAGGYRMDYYRDSPPELAEGEEARYEHNAQGIEDDDASGYNWGPEPSIDDSGVSDHPALQPLDQMLNQHESERYLHPREEPPAHFSQARHGAVAADGLAAKLAFPVQPAQPQQPAAPVWLGHTFAPSHRVALPWRDQIIQGTVTHLDGTNVGVRWDDGQHSVEEPSAIRPLY